MSKNKNNVVVFWVLFINISLALACHNQSGTAKQDTISIQNTFRLPDIPDNVKSVPERMDYLALHYWDNVQGIDKTNFAPNSPLEQSLVDYFDLIEQISPTKAQSSLATLLHKTQVDSLTYAYFKKNLEKYLHDPNSPIKNDELYIPVVKYIISDQTSGIADKSRAEFALKMMLKNRKGEPANNFSFEDQDGKTHKLSDYSTSYTLLYFYNPDCHACKEISARIKVSAPINKLLKAHQTTLLAIYPDEDPTIWKKQQAEIPKNWINGIDRKQELRKKEVYDLSAMPTLYLLDAHKKVLLKDANLDTIESYLEANQKQ